MSFGRELFLRAVGVTVEKEPFDQRRSFVIVLIGLPILARSSVLVVNAFSGWEEVQQSRKGRWMWTLRPLCYRYSST